MTIAVDLGRKATKESNKQISIQVTPKCVHWRTVKTQIKCHMSGMGAQWLIGRVLDSRPRGHGFEPHRRHCVVSLSKTH